MAKVKVEVFPWLSGTFGSRRSERLLFEEEVGDGATMGLLLRKLAADHKEFGDITFDQDTQDLSGHISVILNGRLLELAGGLEANLKDGDSVLLLPAFDGGAACNRKAPEALTFAPPRVRISIGPHLRMQDWHTCSLWAQLHRLN